MERYGLYNALEQTFGNIIKVSRSNNSPVSQPHSSLIRHNYKELYEEKIVPIDTTLRMKFTKDIANFLLIILTKSMNLLLICWKKIAQLARKLVQIDQLF